MEFAHFKTAAQFGRTGVNARFAQRLILYRRLAAKAMAELARERKISADDLLLGLYDHKFSTTQVNLPQDFQDELREWVERNVATEDLHPTEKQEPPFHVTVKYGLHAHGPETVEALLKGWGPVHLTLGSLDTFTTNDDYDVLIVRVQSDDIVRMNHALSDELPHTDTQASYSPHATLAYLKKGAGDKWVGASDFAGREITIDAVQFGSADNDIGKTDIPLVKEFTCAYCGLRRYHLPGQHDQCDHSPTGECSSEKDVSREERRSQLSAQADDLNLDDDHREAINSYVGSGYRDISGLLRQTETLKGQRLSNAKSRIIDLDSAIEKSKLNKPITVYRGMLDRDGQFANPEQFVGKIIEDRGFMSTSLRKQLADDFAESEGKSKGVRFRISIPAGKNALYISAPKLGGDGEQELLLPRRTRLRVTKISIIGGKKWIDATIE